MANSNNADTFRLQYKMMRFSAAWPEENPSLTYQIRGALSYLSLVTLGVTMLMEAFHDIKNLAKLSDILYILVSIIVNIVKYTSFYINRNDFLYCVKLLKNPLFASYPNDLDYFMVDTINSLQRLVQTFLFSICICVCLMGLSPLLDGTSLPFPFPYELGFFRYFMYVFQVGTVGLCGFSNAYLDTLPASFMAIAVAQMDILAYKIIRIRDEHGMGNAVLELSVESDKIAVEKLRECVFHHEAVIEFVEYIDKVFSFSTFMQFVASAIIVCNTLFRLVLVPTGSTQFFMLVLYMGVVLLELFMFCWFGNNVMWKSANIRDACYSCQWYYTGTSVKKYLFIIMERSKRPLKITAFKFSTLSLSAFTAIMQWSYSYFALMMKLYRK